MESAQADAFIRELEQRLEVQLGASEPDPEALAALEADVLRQVVALRLPDDRGNAVLADCAAWRDLARDVGATEGAAAADELAARLIDDICDNWRAHVAVDPNDPDSCFRALAEARALDLEALTRRRGAPPLTDARPDLRALFEQALAAHAPDENTRDRWAMELLDRADVVLTSADEGPAVQSCQRLDVVRRDLTWHTMHVESRRSARRTRLRRRIYRLRAELQERELQNRLEIRFSPDRVGRWDRLVLWLIGFVLLLLGIEVVFDLSEDTRQVFTFLDTCACGIFLTDIVVRLKHVRGRMLWTKRHFLIDILPSIPFAGLARAFRGLRFLRLTRLMRYFRAFGFLSRGIDRIVRKYGDTLNRNIVLYPTRAERQQMEQRATGLLPQVRRMQARISARWRTMLAGAGPADREAVAQTRVDGLRRVRESVDLRQVRRPDRTTPRMDVPSDEVIDALSTITPTGVEAEMGADFVARVARAVRIFALPPLRWLPVLRRFIPRLSKGMSDAEVTVAAARRAAREFRRNRERWLWFADLYGTITPAQFVDRVGTTMVKVAFRPAYRLVLFALIVFIFKGIFKVTEVPFLDRLAEVIFEFVGILGSICIAILGIGWWLRRMAGQATDFFHQSAQAQFLDLTESIKGRHVARDAEIFDHRVFAAEAIVHGKEPDGAARAAFIRGIQKWLMQAQAGTCGMHFVERAVILYRDSLDGALLVANDTRSTAQLLGSPALRTLRILSARFTGRDERRLAKLDLQRQRSLFSGPYLWFILVCQAVSHGVARLLVDYNRHALPRNQLPTASEAERGRYDAWLEAEQVAEVASDQVLYVTTRFTALHFLDDDPQRDAEIADQFGDAVLARLQRDRRHLIRRIFGNYPLHKLPHEERVLNVFRLYQLRLAGGRALLIPFYALQAAWKFARRFLSWLRRCIAEIRKPTFTVDVEAVEGSEYRAALRKIGRMRSPAAEAATRLRVLFDPEYVGVRLPGTDVSGIEESNLDDDLEFLQNSPEFAAEMEGERERVARDMKRLSRELWSGLWGELGQRVGVELTREHLRAAACAYVSDLGEVRRYLSARTIVDEIYLRAARGDLLHRPLVPRFRLSAAFRRYWKAHGPRDDEARRAAWRATVHNVEGVADALRVWDRLGDQAREEGIKRLLESLRHPERISEQLVTLRCVQTLALIDILNYREHIYRLGGYAEDGDEPAGGLRVRASRHA